jgi:D-3-phosphoglycerate dehydrogenase
MKIVVTEPEFMSEDLKVHLAGLGAVSFGPFDDRTLGGELALAEVLMVRLGRFIDFSVFTRAPKLRFVVTATTGLDHIDMSGAITAGVRVISLRDCPKAIKNVSATAEHTIGLMLALMRHIPSAAAHVLNGGWDRTLFWGSQVRGKRLGIIGHGRIGSLVARAASGLGMKVVAYDYNAQAVFEPALAVSFDELIETSDVVSIHVTSSQDNRNLALDKDAIRRLKEGVFLINTARGRLIDEEAVSAGVRSGHLAGVAADVLAGEERGDGKFSPLLKCARAGYNVLITPHIGGATYESIAQAEAAVVDVLAAALRNSVH